MDDDDDDRVVVVVVNGTMVNAWLCLLNIVKIVNTSDWNSRFIFLVEWSMFDVCEWFVIVTDARSICLSLSLCCFVATIAWFVYDDEYDDEAADDEVSRNAFGNNYDTANTSVIQRYGR